MLAAMSEAAEDAVLCAVAESRMRSDRGVLTSLDDFVAELGLT